MNDTTLHRVLNTPPELWSDNETDQKERNDHYKQASKRIENANSLIREAYNRLAELESHSDAKMTDDHTKLMNSLRDSIEP